MTLPCGEGGPLAVGEVTMMNSDFYFIHNSVGANLIILQVSI